MHSCAYADRALTVNAAMVDMLAAGENEHARTLVNYVFTAGGIMGALAPWYVHTFRVVDASITTKQLRNVTCRWGHTAEKRCVHRCKSTLWSLSGHCMDDKVAC